MKILLAACIALGAALVVLLSQASGNTALFARQYSWLLVLGGALAVGLLALIGYQLWTLRAKLKQKVFGAKLAGRLTTVFALMALVPGGLLYILSVQFIEKSVDSWFNVRVESALEGGLNLGRTALDSLLNDLQERAQVMATRLADRRGVNDQVLLNRLREEQGVEEATLFSARGRMIAFAGNERAGLQPERPDAITLRMVRSQQPVRAIEPIGERGLYLRVAVPVNVLALDEDIQVLQVLRPVPATLSQSAENVQTVYRDYQEISLSRVALKRVFALTLTLAMLLTLFSALALAFVLAERLSAPLGQLAESMRAIAKGDFTKTAPVKSRDEFAAVTQSFNSMTRQLAEASEAVSRQQAALEQANFFLEDILANLTSGVLVLDAEGRLKRSNASAQRLLAVDTTRLAELPLERWGEVDAAVEALVDQIAERAGRAQDKPWEAQIEYGEDSDNARTLLVRGTHLSRAAGEGLVIVFDDVTHLIQAQRAAAWGEVARRLAHEIKNPLTPIQLSAERLERKLKDRLPQPEADMLVRSTATIVNQVAALKGMVDDFSLYAKSAQLTLREVSLNDLVREVLTLYESMGVAIAAELAENLPHVEADPALLRQVLHNLMQNSLDALAGAERPEIRVASKLAGESVALSVCDNGAGIAESVIGRIFEPYVTTKARGTGLGLAIVKKIVDEHHGQIQVENVKPHGASVTILLPLKKAA